MKFSALFELHKIPEWYGGYIDYKDLSNLINSHKECVKNGTL